ncbi:MAG: hypothetical protein WEB02_12465 [Methylophaga sp.]
MSNDKKPTESTKPDTPIPKTPIDTTPIGVITEGLIPKSEKTFFVDKKTKK